MRYSPFRQPSLTLAAFLLSFLKQKNPKRVKIAVEDFLSEPIIPQVAKINQCRVREYSKINLMFSLSFLTIALTTLLKSNPAALSTLNQTAPLMWKLLAPIQHLPVATNDFTFYFFHFRLFPFTFALSSIK